MMPISTAPATSASVCRRSLLKATAVLIVLAGFVARPAMADDHWVASWATAPGARICAVRRLGLSAPPEPSLEDRARLGSGDEGIGILLQQKAFPPPARAPPSPQPSQSRHGPCSAPGATCEDRRTPAGPPWCWQRPGGPFTPSRPMPRDEAERASPRGHELRRHFYSPRSGAANEAAVLLADNAIALATLLLEALPIRDRNHAAYIPDQSGPLES